MREMACELLSLTHQRRDKLVSDSVSWWPGLLLVLRLQRWPTLS